MVRPADAAPFREGPQQRVAQDSPRGPRLQGPSADTWGAGRQLGGQCGRQLCQGEPGPKELLLRGKI